MQNNAQPLKSILKFRTPQKAMSCLGGNPRTHILATGRQAGRQAGTDTRCSHGLVACTPKKQHTKLAALLCTHTPLVRASPPDAPFLRFSLSHSVSRPRFFIYSVFAPRCVDCSP